MAKPTLFLAIDGPVVIPSGMPVDAVIRGELAPYAKPFVHWAKDNFKLVWLTDRPPGEALYIAGKLGLSGDAVTYGGFEVSKVEKIINDHNFFWVDSDLIPGEVSWLCKNGHTNRFVSVNPHKGVTEEHKRVLEHLLHNPDKRK